MNCSTKGCNFKGNYRAEFYIHSKNSKTPAMSVLPLLSCSIHASQKSADDLLLKNETGKAQIESFFRSNNYEAPCWERSYAKWVKADQTA